MAPSTRHTENYDLYTDIAILRIDDARLPDVGNYLVVAENEAGKDQTQCNVFVTSVPNVDETPLVNPESFRFLDLPRSKPQYESDAEDKDRLEPPRVIIPLSDVKLEEGQSVLLVCKIDGYPKPKVLYMSCFFIHFLNVGPSG